MRVLVGSENPVKLAAVRQAFARYFEAVDAVGVAVDSQVGSQPMGADTFAGAENRARALVRRNREQGLGAQLMVGLEGGALQQHDRWFAFGAICIMDERGRSAFGASPLFELPPAMTGELLAGVELGHVIDRYTGDHNTKQKGGAVAFLTRGEVDRTSLYVQGLVVALIPFLNEPLFFGPEQAQPPRDAAAPALLIHHAAHGCAPHPPSSLAGLRSCLAASAKAIEVDITPTIDGDFALVHDGALEVVSEGQGPVAAATAAQVRTLHHRWRDRLTDEPLGTLSEAVALVEPGAQAGPGLGLQELQLDLKPHVPMTDAVLASLLRLIAPVKARVRVTSTADWAIRRLAELDGGLALGFDPLLYLDLEREDADGATPPLRTGAYGYLDEHPLATRRWGSPSDYLASRAAVLWAQAPVGMWYIRAAMLARGLDDGFDWITWLHARGAQVTAWTLDADQPHQLALARQLAACGADRITTNDPRRLAQALGGGVH